MAERPKKKKPSSASASGSKPSKVNYGGGGSGQPLPSDSKTKKTALLIALRDEVTSLQTQLTQEKQEREKIVSWLSSTLKPGMASFKKDVGAQLVEIVEQQKAQQKQLDEIRKWIRENRSNISASKGAASSDEVVEMLEREKVARQQMALWVKTNLGPNLEVLDARIRGVVKELAPAASPSAAGAGPGSKGTGAAGASASASSRVLVSQQEPLVILPVSVEEWLLQIGYDRYAPLFEQSRVTTLRAASELTSKALDRIGVSHPRHREDIVIEARKLAQDIVGHQQQQKKKKESAGDVPSRRKSREVPRTQSAVDMRSQARAATQSVDIEKEREAIRQQILADERARIIEEERARIIEEERARIRKEERERALRERSEEREKRRSGRRSRPTSRTYDKPPTAEEDVPRSPARALQTPPRSIEVEEPIVDEEVDEDEDFAAKSVNDVVFDFDTAMESPQAAAPISEPIPSPSRKVEYGGLFGTPDPEPKVEYSSLFGEDSASGRPREPATSKGPVAAASKPAPKKPQATAAKRRSVSLKPPPEGSGPSIEETIARIRSNDDPLDWCWYCYDRRSNCVLFDSSGDTGADDFASRVDDSKVQFGFLRVEDTRIGYGRVKFVYVIWVGSSVGAFLKAKSNTHKNYVARDIGQFHLELRVEDRQELDYDRIVAKLLSSVDF